MTGWSLQTALPGAVHAEARPQDSRRSGAVLRARDRQAAASSRNRTDAVGLQAGPTRHRKRDEVRDYDTFAELAQDTH